MPEKYVESFKRSSRLAPTVTAWFPERNLTSDIASVAECTMRKQKVVRKGEGVVRRRRGDRADGRLRDIKDG